MSRHEVRVTEFEEQDFYPPPPRPGPEFENRPRRSRVAVASPPPRSRVHIDEMDEVDIRVSDREPGRGLAFLNRPPGRSHAGPMVLRQREVDSWDRRRPRSPSPERVREQRRRRPYSVSPPAMRPEHEHEHSRTRIVERERVRSPSMPQRRRSPSARPIRHPSRHRPSPSPVEHEHIHTRIVDRDVERDVSPRPCPSPSPPRVIRGPTIEREVVTHYRDVDHGLVRARSPSPPPPPRPRAEERETDIDISLSGNRTEVDIRRSTSHSRARSGSFDRRRQRGSQGVAHGSHEGLRADIERSSGHRRARSAAPMDDEAYDIRSRIDARGRMGEAWGGATKKWAIIDVPPGTEKVRMDGVGGASTDTTWTQYSGVRRTRFVPERDEASVERKDMSAGDEAARDRTSVAVYEHDREIDVDVDIDIDRRVSRPSPPPSRPPPKDMWTEISKDMVIREAVEQMGYDYQETRYCFYIMDYLKYDDVLRLTELSQSIQRSRRERVREIQWEREWRDEWERPFRRHHHGRRGDWLAGRVGRGDELVREREIIYDSRRPMRDYR